MSRDPQILYLPLKKAAPVVFTQKHRPRAVVMFREICDYFAGFMYKNMAERQLNPGVRTTFWTIAGV